MTYEFTSKIYRLLLSLPRNDFTVQRRLLPRNGIYAFFERGETCQLDGVIVDRIVRIGTHEAEGNLPGRIRQHYGRVKSLGGNKNESVFRRHMGGALMRQLDPTDPRIAGWVRRGGPTYPDVEEAVSRTLRDNFTFACFRVDKHDDRRSLERGLIALLAQYPLGSPSSRWLGLDAVSEKVHKSGLWNANYIDDQPMTDEGCRLFERLVRESVGDAK